MIGLVVWLVWSWTVCINTLHFHHFLLGLWSLFVAFLSLIITGVTFTVASKVGSVSFRYVTIPLVSTLIYVGIAALLFVTDMQDFTRWINNPAQFSWSC